MLGCHPDVYAFPELLLFNGQTVRDIAELRNSSVIEQYWRSGLPRAVAELWFGSQSPASVESARRWIQQRNDRSPELLFDEMLEKVAPKVGVEKCPDTAFSDDRLAACLQSFPNARFIHLVRHPISNIQSLAVHLRTMRAYREGKDEAMLDLPKIARESAQLWLDIHRRILRFSGGLPDDQVLILNAEQLLTTPRTALPPVLRWAGLDAGREAVEPMCKPELWPYARLGPPGAEAGGDLHFLENPTLVGQSAPGSVEPPEAWGLDGSVTQELASLACDLGYTSSPVA